MCKLLGVTIVSDRMNKANFLYGEISHKEPRLLFRCKHFFKFFYLFILPGTQPMGKVLVVLVREPGFSWSKFYLLARLEPGSPA